MLVRDRALLVITEQSQPGDLPTMLRIPVARCVAARITTEPGVPGTALLRLTLTVRLGPIALVDLPLWFPAQCRVALQRLVDEVTPPPGVHDRTKPSDPPRANAAAVPVLEPLTVRRTPDNHDWIAFRAGDDEEVLRIRRDEETVSNEEQG
ncbi:hypothetical protein [Amycolatopsis sp. NPDC051071]|uniref:hypothetical protein n=1 Tax=Amycolatopsis sp. NPDC051071 TaxID=3154637 RepID=UPI003419C545